MELKTLTADAKLLPNASFAALRRPLTLQSAAQNQFADGDLDLRSVGIELNPALGTVRLERAGQPPVAYEVEEVVMLLLEPGTVTRLRLAKSPGWMFSVSPSGKLMALPNADALAEHRPERAPAGSSACVQQALDWEFAGHVGASSQALCDRLVRQPNGLPPVGDGTAHPLDVADFDRCERFLTAVPDARRRLADMAVVSVQWAALVNQWPTLASTWAEEAPTGRAHRTHVALQTLLSSCSVRPGPRP